MRNTKSGHLLVLALLAACTDEPLEDTGTPPPVDADGDGFLSDVDCDDGDANVYPGATEYCDGVDEDCDGVVDGNVRLVWYRDLDGDGFGTLGERAEACEAPVGFALLPTDCDDTNPAVSPAATEIPYNGVDDDCDPSTPDDDLDGDGVPVAEDCDDLDAGVSPDLEELPYNGVDDDCDPSTRDDDVDGDGFLLDEECDDADEAVYPGALERLGDEVDQDCDGGADTTPWIDLGVEYAAMEGPLWAADRLGVALVALVSRDEGEAVHLPGVMWDWSDGRAEPRLSPIWPPVNEYLRFDPITDLPDRFYPMAGLAVASGDEHLLLGTATLVEPLGGTGQRYFGVGMARTDRSDTAYVDRVPWHFAELPAGGVTDGQAPSSMGHVRRSFATWMAEVASVTCTPEWTVVLSYDKMNRYGPQLPARFGSTRRGGDGCWPVRGTDGVWRVVRASAGAFTVEEPVLGPLHDTLIAVGDLPWPDMQLRSFKLDRDVLALVDELGVGYVSLDGGVPVRRLYQADTQSRTSYTVEDLAVSGDDRHVYMIAIVEDVDEDGLSDVVFAHGHRVGRLTDMVLAPRSEDALDQPMQISVLYWKDEVWIAMRTRGVIDGATHAAWSRFEVRATE